jgi:hypothetical protein
VSVDRGEEKKPHVPDTASAPGAPPGSEACRTFHRTNGQDPPHSPRSPGLSSPGSHSPETPTSGGENALRSSSPVGPHPSSSSLPPPFISSRLSRAPASRTQPRRALHPTRRRRRRSRRAACLGHVSAAAPREGGPGIADRTAASRRPQAVAARSPVSPRSVYPRLRSVSRSVGRKRRYFNYAGFLDWFTLRFHVFRGFNRGIFSCVARAVGCAIDARRVDFPPFFPVLLDDFDRSLGLW